MASNIGTLTDRFKPELEQWLPQGQIEQQARDCGHHWRQRKLGPAQTIHLLLVQLVALNASLSAVRHLAAEVLSASALCQARLRLPLQLLRRCCRLLSSRVAEGTRQLDWCGRAVLAVDGVCYYTPDTPPLRRWLGSKSPFGFPLVKVVTLLELGSGVMLHQVPLPHRRGEAPLLGRVLRGAGTMVQGAVVVMDRAFGSFVNLQTILQRQADAVIRIRSSLRARAKTSRQVIRRLGQSDLLVRWVRPSNRCALLSRLRWKALAAELTLRQVSFSVRCRGWRTRRITVITTLLDPQAYPAQKLAELYQRRWQIELQFRHLKQTLSWEMLRCQSVEGVKKELLLRQMAYNVLRGIIARQAQAQQTRIDRISFADALHWLLYCPIQAKEDLRLLQIPDRPGRREPRRRKRRDKNYLPLNCPRSQARKKAA